MRVEEEVDGLIRDLNLRDYADVPAGLFSGGNKRKLCVAIALVGSPQLVLLDEPSSGMDAASKRFLWSAIKRRTASCCTVLTTHSMEESEALCSRIGIMVGGSLRCIGPIQSLKSRYGQGLRLDFRFGRVQPEEIVAFVQRLCPSAKLEELEPPLLTLTVPREAQLSKTFGHLAEARECLDVEECTLTQCTLEQIFILMAAKQGVA